MSADAAEKAKTIIMKRQRFLGPLEHGLRSVIVPSST